MRAFRLRDTGVRALLALCISFSAAAHAGQGVWTSGWPYGGKVLTLAINPEKPTTLYAGGGGGVFKSTDSGGSWAPTGLTGENVGALAINPADPATLYAGGSGGVFKSTDSGGSWTPTGLTGENVGALAINPANPATLYAGGSGGVFKSTDSGGSWTPTGLTGENVGALAINPANPATLYAGMIYRGVFKSTDAGGTWVPVNSGLRIQQVLGLAINPTTPATLYAAGSGGIFKSKDSGGTWADAGAGLTNLGLVAAVAIDPSNSATLYAGAWTPEPNRLNGGLFKSTDSGDTWAATSVGLTDPQIHALAINPVNPASLYAGTGSGGVFRSTNSGVTWDVTNAGLTLTDVLALAVNPVNSSTLYAGTNGGVFKSTDAGGTWSTVNSGLTELGVTALAINPANPSTLYAGTNGGVFKSTDAGGTWATANSGLTELHIRALVIDPSNATTLYAGGIGGVFKSIDASGTWVHADRWGPFRIGFVDALAIDPANPMTLYAGTDVSFFKSTDSGGSWAPAGGGIWGVPFFALAINPSSPETLYAGTYGGVFKSTDAGDTFSATNMGLGRFPFVGAFTNNPPFVGSLTINPTNPATLYAGTMGPNGGGVFRSIDSGSTWAAVDKGLPRLSVRALALDPSGPSTLYAGLSGGGAWQSTAPAEAATILLLPASAHAPGAGGAFYTTDVSVSNVGGANASFTLKFLGNNRDGSSGPEKTFNLEPGKSTTFFDILSSVFNQTNDFGAIRITSSTSLLDVVSVTSTRGFGGTLGQSIPALSESDLIPAGSTRSILYIREGDGFRSNLVLASNAPTSTTVDALLVSAAGAVLATKSYSVPPDGTIQINRFVRDMGVSDPITGARLVLSSSTHGALFTGVVSVIDEATNDPSAMTAQRVTNAGPGLSTLGTAGGPILYSWLLPSCARSNGSNGSFYTSNVAVANVGAAPVVFTFKFFRHEVAFPADPQLGPEQSFQLEAGKSVIYFDILGSVFNQTSAFGAIRITSESPFLNILSVTSTPGFGGTFGQSIPAVTLVDFVGPGTSRSILNIREGDGFRSNLILGSGTPVFTTVDVALVSPMGTTLATKTYFLPPNGMTQVNRVVRDMGVSGPITGARLVLSSSTGVFTGFASVIDEVTNDPVAVEAR